MQTHHHVNRKSQLIPKEDEADDENNELNQSEVSHKGL